MFKSIACLEHNGELIWNLNEIIDTLIAQYAKVSSKDFCLEYPLFSLKDKLKSNNIFTLKLKS